MRQKGVGNHMQKLTSTRMLMKGIPHQNLRKVMNPSSRKIGSGKHMQKLMSIRKLTKGMPHHNMRRSGKHPRHPLLTTWVLKRKIT